MALAEPLAPAAKAIPTKPSTFDIGERDLDAHEKRWTLDEVFQAQDLGLFGPNDYELLEGRLIRKMSQNNPHALTVAYLADALREVYGVKAAILTHSTLRANPTTAPEPDVALLPGVLRDWDGRTFTLGDALLVIEVADTTLRKDRGYKAKLYARLGVPEYWLVDLEARRVELRRGPAEDGAWTLVQLFAESDALPAPNSEEKIPVASILPAKTPEEAN